MQVDDFGEVSFSTEPGGDKMSTEWAVLRSQWSAKGFTEPAAVSVQPADGANSTNARTGDMFCQFHPLQLIKSKRWLSGGVTSVAFSVIPDLVLEGKIRKSQSPSQMGVGKRPF